MKEQTRADWDQGQREAFHAYVLDQLDSTRDLIFDEVAAEDFNAKGVAYLYASYFLLYRISNQVLSHLIPLDNERNKPTKPFIHTRMRVGVSFTEIDRQIDCILSKQFDWIVGGQFENDLIENFEKVISGQRDPDPVFPKNYIGENTHAMYQCLDAVKDFLHLEDYDYQAHLIAEIECLRTVWQNSLTLEKAKKSIPESLLSMFSSN